MAAPISICASLGPTVTTARAGMFQVDGPGGFCAGTSPSAAPVSSGGGSLKGEYWKRPVNSILTDGATNPTNRIDTQINGFGTPNGTFRATSFVYLGNDLTQVTNWLAR